MISYNHLSKIVFDICMVNMCAVFVARFLSLSARQTVGVNTTITAVREDVVFSRSSDSCSENVHTSSLSPSQHQPSSDSSRRNDLDHGPKIDISQGGLAATVPAFTVSVTPATRGWMCLSLLWISKDTNAKNQRDNS